MIYGMEYKELIWSKIENGHSVQTYVIYNGDERREHIMLEYVDGELMYIYTIWRQNYENQSEKSNLNYDSYHSF